MLGILSEYFSEKLKARLHVVEIRYGNDALRSTVATMRRWAASGGTQPATVRYSLFGPSAVLHVDFEREEEANAFAQAFGGIVLPSRSRNQAID
jgi:hypothetical protein